MTEIQKVALEYAKCVQECYELDVLCRTNGTSKNLQELRYAYDRMATTHGQLKSLALTQAEKNQ